MIIELHEILNKYAKKMGYPNWGSLTVDGAGADIDAVVKDTAIEMSGRAFNAGWNERSKRVSYSKKLLDEGRVKEHSYIQQKLGL